MLSLSKKTDYALIALAYLAERSGRVAPAREIAEDRGLPVALLMNILKELQQHHILRSTRGVSGGYELAIDPHAVSLHDLVVALEGPVRLVECAAEPQACHHDSDSEADACRMEGRCSLQAPMQALHHRLVRFLQGVKLAELILPNTPLIPLTRTITQF